MPEAERKQKNFKGNREHLDVLLYAMKKNNIGFWNTWREKNSDVSVVLTGANLSEAVLTGANFKGVNFREANLSGSELSGVTLTEADLSGEPISARRPSLMPNLLKLFYMAPIFMRPIVPGHSVEKQFSLMLTLARQA